MSAELRVIVGHPGTGKTTELSSMADSLRFTGHVVYFAAFTRSVRDEARRRQIVLDDRHARTFAGWSFATLSRLGHVVLGPDESWEVFVKAASRLGIRCGSNPWLAGRSKCWRARSMMHLAIHVAGPNWLDALERVDPPSAAVAKAYLDELGNRLDTDLALLKMATEVGEPPWRPRSTRRVAVIVDEAQDLSPLMWCFLRRFANPELPSPKWCGDPVYEASKVVLAGDPNQSIFETLNGADPTMFTKASDVGVVEVLRMSRRVPRAVYERFAKPLMDAIGNPYAEYIPSDAKGYADVVYPIAPHEEAARLALELARAGAKVGVITNTNDDALRIIYHIVKLGGPRPCTLKEPPVEGLQRCSGEYTIEDPIAVDTVYAWKGLETDVVVYLADRSGAPAPQLTRMAYVAVTRARKVALVVCSRKMDRRVSWLCT